MLIVFMAMFSLQEMLKHWMTWSRTWWNCCWHHMRSRNFSVFFLGGGSHLVEKLGGFKSFFICTYVKQIKCVRFEYFCLKTWNLTSVFRWVENYQLWLELCKIWSIVEIKHPLREIMGHKYIWSRGNLGLITHHNQPSSLNNPLSLGGGGQ